MSGNCPFCTPDSQTEAWGLSPEGWEEARKNHLKNHVVKCPTCGQAVAAKEVPYILDKTQ